MSNCIASPVSWPAGWWSARRILEIHYDLEKDIPFCTNRWKVAEIPAGNHSMRRHKKKVQRDREKGEDEKSVSWRRRMRLYICTGEDRKMKLQFMLASCS